MLDYKEFIELIPEETKEFIEFLLPCLENYLKSQKSLEFRGITNSTNNPASISFFIALFSLAQNPEYENLLGKFGFDKNRVKINLEKIPFGKNSEKIYLKMSSFIPTYIDKYQYGDLFPIDILLPILKQYNQKCSPTIFNELFSNCNGISSFGTALSNYNEEKKVTLHQQLEKEIYGKLPISVIDYLETATKIREKLLEAKVSENSVFQKSDKDIVPLSLFLAVYYYKDIPIYMEENIGEQNTIKEILNSKGITLNNILNTLRVDIDTQRIKEMHGSIVAIKNLYQDYWKDGINKDKKSDEITVSSIFENTLERSFTNSLVMEKLLARMNCYIGNFSSMNKYVFEYMNVLRKNYSAQYVHNFYKDLSLEVKNFMDFTARTYSLILEQMKENKHNSEVLIDEDDADTLALLIANYYVEGDVSQFFNSYGITLNKILSFLGLEITKKKVEKVQLNQKILVDRYKRFVYEGLNRNKSAKSIKISDISHNLCNREFNRSMIIESIFKAFRNDTELSNDFLNQLNKYLTEKEEFRKMSLTQKFFHDMPVDSIEYLENVSAIHHYLEKNVSGWLVEDIKVLSLLLGVFNSNSSVKLFLKSKSFTKEKICEFLKVNSHSLPINSLEADIDLLAQEYGIYIFGGKNKNLSRNELTIPHIVQNIFVKEINNSVSFHKLLASFHTTYDDFLDFDSKYQEYEMKTQEENQEKEAAKVIDKYPGQVSLYLQSVFRIHQRIIESINQKEENYNSEEDILELSMILGLFVVENNSRVFFEKNNITLDYILKESGFNKSILENSSNLPISYTQFLKLYSRYLSDDQYCSNRTISDFARRIFEDKRNSSLFLEEICAKVGTSYGILKEEVWTEKDYVLSLPINDRISLLENTEIDSLNMDDVLSVLHFGNSLSVHSKYIHDEFPKLMLNDSTNHSLETIHSLVGEIYMEENTDSKKGFLTKLFSRKSKDNNSNLVLNTSVVQQLKDTINENIEVLSKELLGYDTIRKYMEVYHIKNRSYYLVACDKIQTLQTELGKLDPNKDDEYSMFLSLSSRLQNMRDKANRFADTNQLMKQELLKVNQAIVNHFISINALEMTRDNLFPLIGAELAINKGRNTENSSLQLSQGVIQLFQSILTKNVEGAVINMEQLKNASIPSDMFNLLNKDIEVYLQNLNQASELQSRIESTNDVNQGKLFSCCNETVFALEEERPKEKRLS